jgi:hypothetical protein
MTGGFLLTALHFRLELAPHRPRTSDRALCAIARKNWIRSTLLGTVASRCMKLRSRFDTARTHWLTASLWKRCARKAVGKHASCHIFGIRLALKGLWDKLIALGIASAPFA